MRIVATLLLLTLAVTISSEVLSDDVDGEARTAFSSGVGYFNEDNYELALVNFKRAYELKPKWKLLFNIGQCHAVLKQYGQAIDAFEQYLAEGGDDVRTDRRDSILRELDRMRKMVGTAMLDGADGIDVFVDGERRGVTPLAGGILLSAGMVHKFRFEKAGQELGESQARVRGGMIVVVKIPQPPGIPLPIVVPPVVEELKRTDELTDSSSQKHAVEEPPMESQQVSEGASDDPESEDDEDLHPALFWTGAGLTVAFAGGVVAMDVACNNVGEGDIDKAQLGRIETMQSLGLIFMATAGTTALATVVIAFFTDFGESEQGSPGVALTPWADDNSTGMSASWRF